MEVWKDIEGYEGYYQISSIGRVRALTRHIWTGSKGGRWETRRGKMRALGTDNDGYKFVTLCKDGKDKIVKVHRLVASAFIPNINNFPFINHKNEIKDDNRVENLEWCTAAYNSNYGTARQRITEKQRKPVLAIPINGGEPLVFESVREAMRHGFNDAHICDCCKGRRNFHKGYKWSYA